MLQNRIIGRLLLWRRICHELHPESFSDQLGMMGSVISDSIRFCIAPNLGFAPQTCCQLLLFAPRLNVHFFVRGDTDDIYNILPFREMDVHDAIIGKLRPGDVFIDAGANIGYYTVLGARVVGPNGTVVAIEAVSSTAKQLAQNLKINRIENTLIVNKAIQSDPDAETVEFQIPQGNFGLASIVSTNECSHSQRLRVDATTIDNICSIYDKIRLMKFDVEGGELAALRGAKKTLAKTDYIVVECNDSINEISQLLSKEGFIIKKLHFTTYIIGCRQTSSSPVQI